MSLSKNQKARRYGTHTHTKTQELQKPARGGSANSRQHDGRGGRAATESAPSFMFAGVACVVAVLLFIYYYFWVLPEFSELAEATIPELMFWFDRDHIVTVQQGLGPDNIVQYQFVHRSSGLVLPLLVAAAWLGMISASRYPPVTARLMKLVPIVYAVVFMTGGFMLDVVIADPHGPIGLAALLVALRWLLLAGCLVQLLAMAVRLIRAKVDAFARGELPGQ